MIEQNFKDKVVWVTGASSGIGEAIAYEIARQGGTLILSSRNEMALNKVCNACHSPEKHIIIPLDLEYQHDLNTKVEHVWREFGPIDILINNAGISHRYSVIESNIELDKKVMNINFGGTVALTRPVLKAMLERNEGQIVVVSSMLGLYGIQNRSAYSASKHALVGYFESLRNELYNTKVKVTLIYPGYIKTNISKNALLPNGAQLGIMDKAHSHAISSEYCAKKIVRGIIKQKATVTISGAKERLGAFLARFVPPLFRYLSPKFKI